MTDITAKFQSLAETNVQYNKPYYLLITSDRVINAYSLNGYRGVNWVTTHAQIREITNDNVISKLIARISKLKTRIAALEAK